jgi:guanine deaminase
MKTSIEPKAESGHCGTRERPTVIRGPVLTFTGNPFKSGLEHTAVYEPDAIVVMAGGLSTDFGQAQLVLPKLPAGTEVKNYGKDALISAGFIDSHVHFPQTPMIAAYGEQLLDWLTNYTFPTS